MGMSESFSKLELKTMKKTESRTSEDNLNKAIEKAKDFDFIRFALCDIQGISR